MLKGRARRPFQPALLPAKFCKLSDIDKQKRELKERILYGRLNPQKKMCHLLRQKAREPCADENTNIKMAQFICGPKRPHPSTFHCRLSNSPCNYDDIICDICDLKVPDAVHFCADTISIEGQNELIDTSILDKPDNLLRDPNKPCTCDKSTQEVRPPLYTSALFFGSPTCGQTRQICEKSKPSESKAIEKPPEVKPSPQQISPKQTSSKQISPKRTSSRQASKKSIKTVKSPKPEKKMVRRISKTPAKGSQKRMGLRKPDKRSSKTKGKKKPPKTKSSKSSDAKAKGPSKSTSQKKSQQKQKKKQRTRSKSIKQISQYNPKKRKFQFSRQKRSKRSSSDVDYNKVLRQAPSSDYYYRQKNANKKKGKV